MTVRVLLVDDHPVVRAGVRALLQAEAKFEVVGEAASGAVALDQARILRPDVVVADLMLPDMDGAAVTARIRESLPGTRVLILSCVGDDDRAVARAVRAGAAGYLTKNGDVRELVSTIRTVASGGVHLSPRAAASLIEGMRMSDSEASLTPRQHEVLREMMRGRSNKEIASSLDIRLTTVKSHVRIILEKLGMRSRTQAALHALRSDMYLAGELTMA